MVPTSSDVGLRVGPAYVSRRWTDVESATHLGRLRVRSRQIAVERMFWKVRASMPNVNREQSQVGTKKKSAKPVVQLFSFDRLFGDEDFVTMGVGEFPVELVEGSDFVGSLPNVAKLLYAAALNRGMRISTRTMVPATENSSAYPILNDGRKVILYNIRDLNVSDMEAERRLLKLGRLPATTVAEDVVVVEDDDAVVVVDA